MTMAQSKEEVRPLVRSLVCVTIACSEPLRLAKLLGEGFGWETVLEGSLGTEAEQLWAIEQHSAGKNFGILRSPDMEHGMIRIVEGRDRVRTRERSARWAGFEIVVMSDIDGLFNRLVNDSDFSAFGAPVDYDFTHAGSNIHRAFSGQLPGGTHTTLTMKITDPVDGRNFPSAKAQVGQIFNVPLNTATYTITKAFYESTLKMQQVLESVSLDGAMHEAWNIPAGEQYSLGIFRGDAPDVGRGAIEIHGCSPKFIDPDPSKDKQFDGGACMVTYTTDDFNAAYLAVRNSSSVAILAEPRPVNDPPYNGAQAFTFFGPNRERIEIIESWLKT